ncbi:MAG: carbohydrate kinase family protein, partial [Anaerolineae bacterium]|nr:carbohydrate kinase family protein [Anaerolineae bacterium]
IGERPVLVIGAACVDMVGLPAGGFQHGVMNLSSNRVTFGGVARNVAENLARLGQPVQLLSVVGQDLQGTYLTDAAQACSIDVSCVLHVEGAPTASYLAVYNSEGHLEGGLEDMRVLEHLSPAFIKGHEECFRQAGLVFVDANLSTAAFRTVFSLARKMRIPVCADTTSIGLSRKFLPYLDRLFLLTANTREATSLLNDQAELLDSTAALEAARNLVSMGVGTAIITLSHFGVCYATEEGTGHIPAIHTRILDPTGAGDALTATLLYGLVNGIPLDESIRLGSAAASLVLRHAGTVFPGLSLDLLYDTLQL